MQLRNVTRDSVLLTEAAVAASFWSRFLGLMGRKSLGEGEGLVIEPANSIHMFFMRFPIDALFVDKEWKVLHIAAGLRPWRISRVVRGSRRVVELPADTCRRTGTAPGDTLELA